MEILSDATFKGSLTLSNSSVAGQGLKFVSSKGQILQLSTPDTFLDGKSTNGCILQLEYEDGGWSGRQIGFSTDFIYAKYLCVVGNAEISGQLRLSSVVPLLVGGFPVFFQPNKTGTIALTSDIPSLSDYLTTSTASSTYLSKTDAESTYVKKVDALKYKRVPIDFDVPANCTKFFTADGTGVCSNNVVSLNLLKNEAISLGQSNCGAVKQVQADVWAIYGGQHFVVEKSSSFAISSSDGYVISAVYY